MIYQEPEKNSFLLDFQLHKKKYCRFFLCVSIGHPDWEKYPLTKSITPLGNDMK